MRVAGCWLLRLRAWGWGWKLVLVLVLVLVLDQVGTGNQVRLTGRAVAPESGVDRFAERAPNRVGQLGALARGGRVDRPQRAHFLSDEQEVPGVDHRWLPHCSVVIDTHRWWRYFAL
jgi:hypothetical protein